jgi:hypothetical protein
MSPQLRFGFSGHDQKPGRCGALLGSVVGVHRTVLLRLLRAGILLRLLPGGRMAFISGLGVAVANVHA